MSDLMELNGLDQSLEVDTMPMLEKIDEIVQESIERGDVYIALDFGVNLIEVAQLSTLGLAKLFYLIKKNWNEFELGDNFSDTITAHMGRHKDTVDRHIRVWEMYESDLVPESIVDDIRQKNIKDQIPIANMLSQGYEVDEDEWQKIVDAPDNSSVLKEIRDIKGVEPRKSALLIFMSETGELSAQQEGMTQFVGYLDINDAGDIAEKAIQRLLKSAGVLQR
jgi:hypothetical protein